MRKQVLLALTVLVMLTLACSLVSRLGGSSGDSEDIPAPAPETEAPAGSQGAGAGPETISLVDPALYATDDFPAYKLDVIIKQDGVDTAGNPNSFSLDFVMEYQEQPKAQRISMTGENPLESLDFVILGDQMMSVLPGVGCSVFPVSSAGDNKPEEMAPDIKGLFIGQAEQVETGVEIDGILTDRYKLTSENLNSFRQNGLSEIKDGSVYVAQDGGFLVRIEVEGISNSSENGFDPDTDTLMSMNYTFVPVETGTLNITPPLECADQLSGGSEYPIMDGATDLVSTQDVVFYSVNASLEDVQEFYRTNMVEDGWTLVNDIGGGSISFATMEFTKDDESVEVAAIANGDEVTVTITKK